MSGILALAAMAKEGALNAKAQLQIAQNAMLIICLIATINAQLSAPNKLKTAIIALIPTLAQVVKQVTTLIKIKLVRPAPLFQIVKPAIILPVQDAQADIILIQAMFAQNAKFQIARNALKMEHA